MIFRNTSDEELKQIADANIGLLLLKYIFRDELIQKLGGILSLFKELKKKDTGLEYLHTLIKYIMTTAEGVSIKELKGLIETNISKDIGGETMTIAEQLIQEGIYKGRQEGKQEGKQEGIQESIIDVLDTRFGNVSEDIKNRIESIRNIELLERLHKEAILSKELNKFFVILLEIGVNKN